MSTTARHFAWLVNSPAAYHASEQAQAAQVFAEAQRIIAGLY